MNGVKKTYVQSTGKQESVPPLLQPRRPLPVSGISWKRRHAQRKTLLPRNLKPSPGFIPSCFFPETRPSHTTLP